MSWLDYPLHDDARADPWKLGGVPRDPQEAALDAAMDEGARYVLVDFADVAFLDSTGIGVLLSVERKLRTRDGKLIVVCDEPLIRRVFEIGGLTDVLNIRPSRRAALSAAGEFARASQP
jgi:anti-anti-sigma factor